MQIKGTFGEKFRVYSAIAQRLMYIFGFTQEQAWNEIKFLVVNGQFMQEDYYMKVSRVGCTAVLSRRHRKEIWKHCKAIADESNKENQDVQ